MKKYFLIVLTICAIKSGYSQTEKGKMLIGGQFNVSGYANSNLDTLYNYDTKSSGFQIAPNIGYFIKDNIAIGANVIFGILNSTRNHEYADVTLPKYTYKNKTLSFGIGGFARYYIKIVDNFMLYFDGGMNYTYQTQKITNSTNDPNYIYPSYDPANQEVQVNNISLAISPGLVYFVTPKLGIQTAFGNINYSYSGSKNISLSYDNHVNESSYGINLNITSFYFGLNYYF